MIISSEKIIWEGEMLMAESIKSQKILDALQQLLEEKSIRHISVSEIA